MKKLVVGILAHVDVGKTTLSEGLLYETGVIRKRGRVDTKDAYLDNDSVERERGITIYSKVAKIPLKDTELILIDTPGHIDFSTEMERSLSVMDVAILLISGSSGVQPHTKTLWNLLRYYNIPTFIFVNKTDLASEERIEKIKKRFGEEVDIAGDETYGDRTNQWFWHMVMSLGLGGQWGSNFDKDEVDECLERFYTHQIDDKGFGTLFRFKHDNYADKEIWWQVTHYLNSIATY